MYHKISMYLFLSVITLLLQVECVHGVNVVQKVENTTKVFANVDIRNKTQVAKETILLRDIADIDAGAILKEKLENIKIGPSPRPGEDKYISGNRVASIIQTHKWIPDDLKITVPEYSWISRSFQTIEKEHLRRLLYDYVARQMDNKEWGLREFRFRGRTRFPVGEVSLAIMDYSDNRLSGNISGRVSMTALVNINGKQEGRVALSGWVDRYEKIVFAKHSIIRGAIIKKDDLGLKSVNISKVSSGLLTSLEVVTGKRLKRDVRSGTWLKDNMLEMPNLINKGDRVKLVARKGALEVVTTGLAKSSGRKDEQITVENIGSAITVVGVVIDATTVEILF